MTSRSIVLLLSLFISQGLKWAVFALQMSFQPQEYSPSQIQSSSLQAPASFQSEYPLERRSLKHQEPVVLLLLISQSL